MPIFSFAIGLTLRRGQQLLEFRRSLENGDVQFEDPLNGRIYNWPLDKTYREINDNTLQVVFGSQQGISASDGEDKEKPGLITSLDSIPMDQRNALERRFDYINSAKKKGISKGQRRLIKEVIKKTAERRKEKAPSTSTVMQWWRLLDDAHMNPSALVSGYYKRQRRKKLSEKIQDLIRKILREEYFTLSRNSLSRSHLLVNRQIKIATGEGTNISISTVRRIANEVDGYRRDMARFGAAFAKNKWRYSLAGTVTKRVLERVEVDHTQLDIVVICDRSGLPLGRPTITIVIDAYSKYVIGFFVSFWGTGLGPTLNAMRVAICPKDIYWRDIDGISNPWMGHGLFELAVVDNGLEFHSQQFKLVAWHLNADIQYCAVRQPWLKPTVERALGIVTQNLPSFGKVHKPENNYLPPDPRKTAAITFSQLCTGLLKHFLDVMPFETNNYTLEEPFETFRAGFESTPPPLFPSSFTDIELVSAMSKKMTVGNEGVVTDYLRYNSTALQQLRRQVSHSFKTNIKYYPEDLNSIYVQDPRSNDWLMVPSCDPEYTTGLSVVQHRAIRAHLKEQLKRRGTYDTLIRGKLELIDLYDGFLRGDRAKKSIKTAQQFGSLTSSQTLLGLQNDEQITIRRESQLVESTSSLLVPAHQIPNFSSFSLD